MAKKKGDPRREARKERAKAAKEARRAAEKQMQRLQTRRRRVSALIAVLTFGVAAACYWGFDEQQLTGVVLLVGGVLFLLYTLGALGAHVKPRDRNRAGSIDFGRRD